MINFLKEFIMSGCLYFAIAVSILYFDSEKNKIIGLLSILVFILFLIFMGAGGNFIVNLIRNFN